MACWTPAMWRSGARSCVANPAPMRTAPRAKKPRSTTGLVSVYPGSVSQVPIERAVVATNTRPKNPDRIAAQTVKAIRRAGPPGPAR
jgi:hypothetical protein